MRVTLIDFTGKGQPDPARYAAALLIFTKNTRLEMSPGNFEKTHCKAEGAAIDEELSYMSRTIPSSWEFVDYTFAIEGVTRAFTHQLVRTRTASYAQQAMRVLDVRGFDYATGPSIFNDEARRDLYDSAMASCDLAYRALIDGGAKPEDARGVLPTNICTNIIAKMNMRTFVDLCAKRGSARVQGEYRGVLEGMKTVVRAVHPFIDEFIASAPQRAIEELQEAILDNVPEETALKMIKNLDILRRNYT